jgi:hypothetical protein
MSNHSDNPKHIGSDRNSNSDKDKKKESGVSCYLIAYVIALIAIDAVALIAWAWLFYYIAALLLFILFADVLSSAEYVKGKWSETSVTFLVWQGVTFLMAGIFFALDINPINTWWDVTWPGLVSFLLFLLVSIVVLYRQSKDTDAMPKNRATRAEALVGVSVVVAAFMGAVSHLLSVLNPPEEATEIARWLSNDGLPIAFVFYFLTGIGIAGLTVYHTTCNAKVPCLTCRHRGMW